MDGFLAHPEVYLGACQYRALVFEENFSMTPPDSALEAVIVSKALHLTLIQE